MAIPRSRWWRASPGWSLGPTDDLRLFLAAYLPFRFAVEFVRGNPLVALGLTRSQWFLLATSPLLAWYFVRRTRSGVYRRHKIAMSGRERHE